MIETFLVKIVDRRTVLSLSIRSRYFRLLLHITSFVCHFLITLFYQLLLCLHRLPLSKYFHCEKKTCLRILVFVKLYKCPNRRSLYVNYPYPYVFILIFQLGMLKINDISYPFIGYLIHSSSTYLSQSKVNFCCF